MMKRKRILFFVLWLALTVGFCAATAFVVRGSEAETQVELQFLDTDGRKSKVKVLLGEEVELPEAASFAGYTFLGWQDEQGDIQAGKTMIAVRDASFKPLFTVALRNDPHVPYLFPVSQGIFCVYEDLKWAEAVQMFSCLLAVDVEGTGNYQDVPPDADYARAASQIYQLGILPGQKLHPEESVTRGEFFAMLAAFYPPSGECFSFADVLQTDSCYDALCTAAERGWIESGEKLQILPHEAVSKLEAVKLINRALDRPGLEQVPEELRGFVPDISFEDPDYGQILEAALAHSHEWEEGKEVWTSHESFTAAEPGMYRVNGGLYCVEENGMLLRNGSRGNLFFNERGRYTTGEPELDALVEEHIGLLIRDENADPLKNLRLLYNYTVHSFSYQKGHSQIDGDISWFSQEAYDFLRTGKGNCYSFSSAFAAFARALGFDATIQPGTLGKNRAPHCWVTIPLGGKEYIFDPEMENAQLKHYGKVEDMFRMSSQAAEFWEYRPYTPEE